MLAISSSSHADEYFGGLKTRCAKTRAFALPLDILCVFGVILRPTVLIFVLVFFFSLARRREGGMWGETTVLYANEMSDFFFFLVKASRRKF